MKPVLKKFVFTGKAITDIKSKIINNEPVRVIRKTDAPFLKDTVVFAIDVELMQVVIIPALYYRNNIVKRNQ